MINIYYNVDEGDPYPHKMTIDRAEEVALVINLLKTSSVEEWEDYTAEEMLDDYSVKPSSPEYTGGWIGSIDLQILQENCEILGLEIKYIHDSKVHHIWGGG